MHSELYDYFRILIPPEKERGQYVQQVQIFINDCWLLTVDFGLVNWWFECERSMWVWGTHGGEVYNKGNLMGVINNLWANGSFQKNRRKWGESECKLSRDGQVNLIRWEKKWQDI